MSEEEKLNCPKCGALVSRIDKFCRNCGATLLGFRATAPEVPASPEHMPEKPPYERKFSSLQRLYKLLRAPSEAMKDIALAPDYEGVVAIIAADFVIFVISTAIALQKIQFVGTYAGTISSMLVGIMTLAVFLGVVLFIVKWLLKSLIVKYACDGGSGWSFKTAASVTGYAYITNIILSILGVFIAWLLVPTFLVDTTDLQSAIGTMNTYRAQLNWLILVYSLPVSLLGLLWKSYLGGLGTRFGTEEKCSLGMGIAVFFGLGFIGFLISFFAML